MKFDYDAKYFNPEQVLDCGQVFRYERYKDGYFLVARDKACYLKSDKIKTVVECDDVDFFYDYFDLGRDYSEILRRAKEFGVPLLTRACEACRGLRLLNQDKEEMIYSFIISQNNNIPRIKGIISRICAGLGEKRNFGGREYFTFPATQKIAAAGAEFFKAAGAGYRDTYLVSTAQDIARDGLGRLDGLDGESLKREIMKFKGVGEKVADCIALFAFSKRDSFPVDTWVEKIYREDFGGALKDRKAINRYFCGMFGDISGYVQQYLFYAKRQNL